MSELRAADLAVPDLAARDLPDWTPVVPAPWRVPLAGLALCWAVLIILFRADWLAMAGQWWNTSTYTHVLLVPVVIGWMVHLRWPDLRRMEPQGWLPGLLALALALGLWLAGTLSGINLASQAGAVAMLPAIVLALLGPRIAAGLAFPLAYTVFLVPFGDELVPALQTVTARLTIALTQWSGVAATIEGVFIDTPAGLFEVAEACSGIKFLIAMAALGVLVAHVCFRSWRRRAAFMVAALALPILANGVRAWGTIYIAQFRGLAFAAGFDHIFYGWLFFALVIALLLAAGWPFFDRPAQDRFVDPDRLRRSPLLARMSRGAVPGWQILPLAILMTVAAGQWCGMAQALQAPLPARIDLPRVSGWARVASAPAVPWQPRGGGADHRLLGRYADGQGHTVDVFVALHSGRADGREPGAFGEGALVPGTDWRWQGPAAEVRQGQDSFPAEWLQARGVHRRLAVTVYRTGSMLTGSNARLRLAMLQARLALQARPVTVLILSSADGAAQAPASVDAFLAAAGPIGRWMDRVAGQE